MAKSAVKKIEIYSTPTCHYCNEAKEFFKANGLVYTEHNVQSDLAMRKQMVEKSGQLGVPVIDVGGEVTVGFDRETLAKMLGI
jgi:glutaredoxin 3